MFGSVSGRETNLRSRFSLHTKFGGNPACLGQVGTKQVFRSPRLRPWALPEGKNHRLLPITNESLIDFQIFCKPPNARHIGSNPEKTARFYLSWIDLCAGALEERRRRRRRRRRTGTIQNTSEIDHHDR
jgi:hypothetical protein